MPFEELEAILQTLRRDLLAQREVLGLDRLGRVLIETVGVVGLAEEAGRAALSDHAGFLQRPRQLDEGQHRLLGRLELGDVAAGGGKVRRGWAARAGRRAIRGPADSRSASGRSRRCG